MKPIRNPRTTKPDLDTSRKVIHPPAMFRIGVKSRFSAAHSLREYGGNCEKLHGHNWVVELVCQSNAVDTGGMVIDFRELKKALAEILDTLDHNFLNEIEPFRDKNPSSENIAAHIYEGVSSRLPPERRVNLVSVKVWESEDSWAEYSP